MQREDIRIRLRLHSKSYCQSEKKRIFRYNALLVLSQFLLALSIFSSSCMFFYLLFSGPWRNEIILFGHVITKVNIQNRTELIKYAIFFGSSISGVVFSLVMLIIVAAGGAFAFKEMDKRLKLSLILYNKKIITLIPETLCLKLKEFGGIEEEIYLDEYELDIQKHDNCGEIIIDAVLGKVFIPI